MCLSQHAQAPCASLLGLHKNIGPRGEGLKQKKLSSGG